MANEQNTHLEELLKVSLDEAKKKAKAKKREEEEEEEGEEEEEESSKKKKVEEEASIDEETLAASTLKPAAKAVKDPMALDHSKVGVMGQVMNMVGGMSKDDLNKFAATLAQFGPGKDYGVGDKSGSNQSTIDMKASDAVASKGPKTKDAMPKLNVKEDVEEMFNGYELTEDFKLEASTLFEAALSARMVFEAARLEEEYSAKLNEQMEVFQEELTNKLDTYLDYVVEQWMKDNAVAIESSLRNEIMEEFIDGLKGLFAEHYISVPENKIDVVEALAEKVSALEEKLNETITENAELKNAIVADEAEDIFEELASDLALTQQEKFAALAEGIEFDGDLETYSKKLMIIKENYFRNEQTSYSSNIEEETFEGDIENKTVSHDPQVNRYVQALARTVKK
jgi:hypothetical protein